MAQVIGHTVLARVRWWLDAIRCSVSADKRAHAKQAGPKVGKASCHDVEEPKQRRGPVIEHIIPDRDPAILSNDPLLPEGESKQTIPEIETGRHPPTRAYREHGRDAKSERYAGGGGPSERRDPN